MWAPLENSFFQHFMIVSNKFRLAYSILCILQIINFTYEESFFQTDIFEKLNQIDTNIFLQFSKLDTLLSIRFIFGSSVNPNLQSPLKLFNEHSINLQILVQRARTSLCQMPWLWSSSSCFPFFLVLTVCTPNHVTPPTKQ